MNLEFRATHTEKHNGIAYYVQRARIPNPGRFWQAYKHSELKSKIQIESAFLDGEKVFYVVRLLPVRKSDPLPTFNCSFNLSSTKGLLSFQPIAVRYLANSVLRNGGAADGSDTGIGKTYVALKTSLELNLRPAIVCKKAGIASWREGCEHFGIDPLFIVNWEMAKGARFPYAERSIDHYSGIYNYRWNLPKNTLTIFDEVHSANHEESQNNRLFRAIKYRPFLALSATFADKPTRLKTLLHNLDAVHEEDFDVWLESRGCFVNQHNQYESLSERQDMLEVNKILFPRYGFRLSYDDPKVKPYFPEGIYQTLKIDLGKKKTRTHNRLYEELVEVVDKYHNLAHAAEKLVKDLRYRQAAELLKADSLVELANTYMEQGLAVCIFVNFRETLSYLAKKLDTRHLIFGEQERFGLNREAIRQDFQNDRTRLILCMTNAGGQSLSLHDVNGHARRISLICPTYDAVMLMQLLGRTRRANSKSVPIMKFVYSAGTIEEKVADRVRTKLRNIRALNDGDLIEDDLFDRGYSHEPLQEVDE